MTPPAIGLDAEQVLLEARNKWRRTMFTTRTDPDALYAQSTPIRRFTALDAILSVQREYPENRFWETADLGQLAQRLIRQLDADLRAEGTTYQERISEPLRRA